MQKRVSKRRPEYLWSALMCVAVALFILLLIVVSSCRASLEEDTSSVSSAQTSQESSAESSEESSEPIAQSTATHTVNVDSNKKWSGILAVTTFTEAYEPEELIDLPSIASDKSDAYGLSKYSLCLQTDATKALNRLADAFTLKKGKNNLIVDKAYVKPADLTDKTLEADLATGNALVFSIWPPDPDGDTIGSGKFLWLADNCNQYGYILRYPSEKSGITGVSGSNRIYRYVGYAHAAYMGRYHLCLEEYLDLIRSSYTVDAPLLFTYTDATGTEKNCEIYYVQASSADRTDVTVRGEENTAYAISGDGQGGFIVTCYPEPTK